MRPKLLERVKLKFRPNRNEAKTVRKGQNENQAKTIRKCQIHKKNQKHVKSQKKNAAPNEFETMEKLNPIETENKTDFLFCPHKNYPGNAPGRGKGTSPRSCRACMYSPYAALLQLLHIAKHNVYITRLIALCLTTSHMRHSGSCISMGSHA